MTINNIAKKKTYTNFLITLICQLIILAFGFLVPKVTVSSLGSESNGFLTTINDIFVYISLVEAGLGQALLNALYKPIHCDDKERITGLLNAAKLKYRNISLVYLIVSAIVAVIFPLCVNSKLAYTEMLCSILAYGVGGASTLFLSSYITQYLMASGHGYVKESVHLIIYVLNSLSKIVCIIVFKNIVFVCLAHSIISIIEGLIYKFYFNKKFKQLSDKNIIINDDSLKEQKYFLIHQISTAIFGATDLFIISIFCSLNDSSIYSVYALIFTALNTIMSAIFESLKYILGDAYVDNIEKYKKIHDTFEAFYLSIMFALFFVAYILACPFVGVYMKDADIDYVDKLLPLLFVSAKLLSTCRIVCNNTHNIAHKVKENIIPTIIESSLNLIISLIFVNIWGVYGVLFGTIVALLFRTNQTIIYTNRNILHRSSFATYKYILVYSVTFILGVICFNYFVNISVNSYFDFCKYGLLLTVGAVSIFISLSILLNKDVLNLFKRIFIKNKDIKQ